MTPDNDGHGKKTVILDNLWEKTTWEQAADGESRSRRTRWTARDLMAATFPEPKWAVPGILPEGLTFFAGPPKVGKSWLAYGLAVAIASGGLALGNIAVEQGDVLYLALEDRPKRLQDRLRVILGERGEVPQRLDLWTECPPINLGGGDQIRAWLDDHPDCRLIFADTLAKIRGPRNTQASAYDTDYSTGTLLKAIADDYAVPFTVNHHTRKASSDDFLEDVSGTQGLAGAADTVAVLRRARGSADAIFKLTGRDVDEADYALRFAADLGAWQMLDGPATDYDVRETRSRILRLLRDSDTPMQPKAVAEQLELEREAIRQTLRRMVDDDQLDTDGHGNYFLPLDPVTSVTPSQQGKVP